MSVCLAWLALLLNMLGLPLQGITIPGPGQPIAASGSSPCTNYSIGGGYTCYQTNSADSGAGQLTLTIPYTSNNTAGSLLTAVCRYAGTGSYGSATFADTKLNSWTLTTPFQDSALNWVFVGYAPNASAGANSVVFTVTLNANFIRCAILEMGGVKTSSPVDVLGASNNSAGSFTSIVTANITTLSNNDVIFFYAEQSGIAATSLTLTGGPTLAVTDSAVARDVAIGYQVGNIGTYSGTFTWNSATQSASSSIAFLQ